MAKITIKELESLTAEDAGALLEAHVMDEILHQPDFKARYDALRERGKSAKVALLPACGSY